MTEHQFPIFSSSFRLSLAALVILCLGGALPAAPPPDDQPAENPKSAAESADRKQQREDNLKAMKSRVSRTTVRTAGERTDAEMITRPLLHYTDEPRRIIDQEVWSQPAAKGPGSFDTWVWFWEQE